MNRVNNIMSQMGVAAPELQAAMEDCAFMDDIEAAKPDAILGVSQAFARDTDERKINVSIGAYRTDEGKPLVLKCVKEAEKLLLEDKSLNKEYLKQRGDQDFAKLARELLFGKDCTPIKEDRIASVQSLSGTGALRIGAEFIKRFLPGRKVYYSNPTWGAHKTILSHAGVEGTPYRYWDAAKKNLDIDGMLADIASAPMGSIFLLHAAAHNPTGVDPTKEQWQAISAAMHANGNICWFDSAYQGFATGDLAADAYAITSFANAGHPIIASQSFAKNIGLYGERVGTFSVVCANKGKVAAVLSQLDIIIRNLYSNPPKHGAYIVKKVLSTPALNKMWQEELLSMSLRIQDMRSALKAELLKLGTPGNWDHITSQIGMFSFTGLNPAQCKLMVEKHHIYMLGNGRISMAGVNTKNVKYMAACIDAVVRS